LSSSSHPSGPEAVPGRIAIVGLGLIGGSLARALAALERPPRVTGWSPDASDAAAAVEAGVLAEQVTSRAAALRDAEMVVLAAPLGASLEALELVAREAPPDATITDVVSLKSPLEAEAAVRGLGDRWVGAHPMAGGERSGFEASSASLFEGTVTWIVPGRATGAAKTRVRALWSAVGARPTEIGGEEHDRMMALVSHLPQLTANALATVLSDHGLGPTRLGSGGRDMTRLASSAPSMWADLLRASPPELVEGLRALAGQAEAIAEALERGDVDAICESMERTRRWREHG